MNTPQVYAVCCPRCEESVRVPGWDQAAAAAAPHAERGCRISIRRVWLRPADGAGPVGAGVYS